jgi:hypothetical protein
VAADLEETRCFSPKRFIWTRSVSTDCTIAINHSGRVLFSDGVHVRLAT